MKISMDKKYRTRDGNEARIYATDGIMPYPVHGAVLVNGSWLFRTWKVSGETFNGYDDGFNLVEVRASIKRTVWLNIYPNRTVAHDGVKGAKISAIGPAIFARVKCDIDCEEGEGLEDE